MSDTPIFTPELEGLLREAAGDPRSVLLRVPRPSPLRTLLARQEPLKPTATGLAALDRHLLAVHREELSQALLEGCLVRLYSNPDWSLSVHRTRTATEDWDVEAPREWAERTREKVETLASAPAELVGLDLLQACVEPGGLEAISITQLARASLRLAPSAPARAWIAFEMRLVGRYADAIRLVDQQLAEHVPPSVAAALLEYRASSEASTGNYVVAASDASRAFAEDSRRVSTLVNGLHYSILAGDLRTARLTSQLLDAIVGTPAPGLVEQCGVFEQLRRVGRLHSDRIAHSTAQALATTAGAMTRKITDVHS
ncbi:MAG TPA: hypothetical protein VMT18_02205 [Planctomycetota bacterium]|nr:hypothetical protein [Planctomycetota bacterium]